MKTTYRSTASACGLALLALTFGARPAAAASKEIERLLIQVANLQLQVGDLHRLVGDNAREIKRLADTVGEQNAGLRKALQDQKLHEEALQATLKEMSDRLTDIATAGATPSLAASTAGGDLADPRPHAPPPMDLLSQAYADCRRGNYDLGIQGLREFLRMYPSTDRSDNAQYWIGECLYGKERFAEAIEAWDVVLTDFPSSDKIADARVKKGLALERLGRRREAYVIYKYVLDHYPNSEAAKVARNKLNPQ